MHFTCNIYEVTTQISTKKYILYPQVLKLKKIRSAYESGSYNPSILVDRLYDIIFFHVLKNLKCLFLFLNKFNYFLYILKSKSFT